MRKDREVTSFFLAVVVYAISCAVLYRIMPESAYGSLAVYLGTLTCSLMLAVLEKMVHGEKLKRLFIWLALVCLALPMMFRAQTGMDDLGYKAMFIRAGDTDLIPYLQTSGKDFSDGSVEVGFLGLNYILYYLTNGNYNVAQVAITLLTFFFFGLAMRKTGGDEGLPLQLLLIWSNFYFIIMRAGLQRIFLAVAIVYYALSFLFAKRTGIFVVFVLTAALIHMSALFMLLLILLNNAKSLETEWLRYIAIMAIVSPLAFYGVARFLVPLLPSRWSVYGNVSNLSLSVSSFDTLPILILCALRINSKKEQVGKPDRSYYIGLVMIALSSVIGVCSSIVPLGRLVFYTNLGIVYLLPRVCNRMDGTLVDLFMPAIAVVYAFVYVGFTCFVNAPIPGNLFPYVAFI